MKRAASGAPRPPSRRSSPGWALAAIGVVHVACLAATAGHELLFVPALFSAAATVLALRFRYLWPLDAAASVMPAVLLAVLEIQAPGVRRELFGALNAVFALTKGSVLTFALSERAVRPAWVFLACLTVYAMLTPWTAKDYQETGDEPHYLVLAASLATDGDFRVENNYPPGLDPHVVSDRGRWMLWHDVGTSLAILPGYAVAGRLGAMYTINAAAALVVGGIYELGLLLGASAAASLVSAAVFGFASPLVYYSSQIYPEVLGAACCAWAAVFFIRYTRTRRRLWIVLAGLMLALEPWLSIRFWMLVGGFGGVMLLYLARARAVRDAVAACLPMAVSLVLFAVFDLKHFGTPLPNAGYLAVREIYPQFWLRPHVAFLGLWLDRGNGLIPLAPVYLAALAGLAWGWAKRWAAAALCVPAGAYLLFLSFSRNWHGGWCPPGRFILAAGLLLAPFAAFSFEARRGRLLVRLLAAWTAGMSLVASAVPLSRFPSLNAKIPGGLFSYLNLRLHLDFSAWFPSWERQDTMDYLVSAAWLAVAAACVWWIAGRVRTVSLLAVTAGLCAAAAPFMHVYSPGVVYRQQITSSAGALAAVPGQRLTVPVELTNTGSMVWSTARGVTLSYRWMAGGTKLPVEGLRTLLPGEVEPGGRIALEMTVEAPAQPGEYELRVSLVHEGFAWFLDKSGEYLSLPVRISVR